jgi:hypothetical protein
MIGILIIYILLSFVIILFLIYMVVVLRLLSSINRDQKPQTDLQALHK